MAFFLLFNISRSPSLTVSSFLFSSQRNPRTLAHTIYIAGLKPCKDIGQRNCWSSDPPYIISVFIKWVRCSLITLSWSLLMG
ncbi:hypothetical protein K435DRAFT_836600 [Dendrothele bispora CBS 962.96]|uniref:Uncharacterized protein n=1 Tax=Dendrothele bispora (strain CBS 962.96) TaxID=1314807 RepID=A0A4S8MHJ1_DENBC|nr:hypothetical protein K435DRAFT_836600 [Dendrothele bispora CBS 962.96]